MAGSEPGADARDRGGGWTPSIGPADAGGDVAEHGRVELDGDG
jgi:hypothetical protein